MNGRGQPMGCPALRAVGVRELIGLAGRRLFDPPADPNDGEDDGDEEEDEQEVQHGRGDVRGDVR